MHVTKQVVQKKLHSTEPSHLTHCRGRAAVAFLISGHSSPMLTLCIKASHLRKHAGEVSLPGGKLEDDDVSAVAAALRELREETGLRLEQHHALGYLNPIESLYELSVIPCVFWSDTFLRGSPQEEEIAEVFTVPLTEFVEQTPRFELSVRRSPERWMPRWRYHNVDIWGLTALIVSDFFETVFNARFEEALPSKL